MRTDLYDRSMEIGEVYHVYNRGVAKMPIFLDGQDYQRFIDTLNFYLDNDRPMKLSTARLVKDAIPCPVNEPTSPLAKPLAYCLMPNHFHLALQEQVDKGISRFMRRVLISYTRYFNTRHGRVGPVFQGTFRFVRVENDEQLLHLSRYIHLNPIVARLVQHINDYHWTSYHAYITAKNSRLCHPALLLELAGSPIRYESFVMDFVDYAQSLSLINKHVFEEID